PRRRPLTRPAVRGWGWHSAFVCWDAGWYLRQERDGYWCYVQTQQLVQLACQCLPIVRHNASFPLLVSGATFPITHSPLCSLPLRRFLLAPAIPHGFVLGREFRGVVHERWHRVTDTVLVGALQPLYDLIEL